MNPEVRRPTIHHHPNAFRDALSFTAAESGFSPRLIEKDYYCTLLLHDLSGLWNSGLIFKGGTSLSKVHAGFYRLSEDLDFIIPVDVDVSRSVRREKIEPVKQHFASIPIRLSELQIIEAFIGNNLSKQYLGRIGYLSAVTGQIESIVIEVGLREPLLTKPLKARAKTLLRTPETNSESAEQPDVTVLSTIETYAEKIRAALSRQEPKIRDYYDIAFAINAGLIDPQDAELKRLVGLKLAVPGNAPIDISASKKEKLSSQIDSELKSVLRADDHAKFQFNEMFDIVAQIVIDSEGEH